jgi:hypothetical protein
LSQRVKAPQFSIQHWGKAVAMELLMHRQFVINRENTAFSRRMRIQHTNNVSFLCVHF